MRIKLNKAIKPGKVDMSGELDLNLTRSPAIGPGSLKPNMGRGGVPIPDSTYFGDSDLEIKSKKGKPATSSGENSWSELL